MIELLAPLEDYVRSIGGGKFAARFTMNEVTAEAYEPVERGLLTDRDFRDFTFANPVKIFAGSNPDFFKGTRIEAEVEAETNTERRACGKTPKPLEDCLTTVVLSPPACRGTQESTRGLDSSLRSE